MYIYVIVKKQYIILLSSTVENINREIQTFFVFGEILRELDILTWKVVDIPRQNQIRNYLTGAVKYWAAYIYHVCMYYILPMNVQGFSTLVLSLD